MLRKKMMKTMLNSLPDIAHIRKTGFFDFRHIDPITWADTREEFHTDPDDPITLPSWDRLGRFGDRRDLKLMLGELVVDIYFRNMTQWRYTFRRGFITDFSSVPAYFRSVVDNDDIDMLLAALCHDRGFSVHKLTFKQTNELFYKMVMFRDGIPGANDVWISLPVRAKIAWLAVKSVFGRIRWAQNVKRRASWTLATSTFEKVR